MALTQPQRDLRKLADPAIAQGSQRFFKTGPGEYSAGDKFLGVRVPRIRELVRHYGDLKLDTVVSILSSSWHEERLFALLAMVYRYERGDDPTRQRVFNAYLKNLRYVNNWDLVDASAYKIMGPHLFNADRQRIFKLARSPNLWRRRVAIIATLYWIKHKDTRDTYILCEQLMDDDEDLIHKASGWMLREAGKIDSLELQAFLDKHHQRMPRTMLRYAIEQLPKATRQRYLR